MSDRIKTRPFDPVEYLDTPEAVRAYIEEQEAEIERLRRIIDSRPAINAALPDSYIAWSQQIYLVDALDGVPRQ